MYHSSFRKGFYSASHEFFSFSRTNLSGLRLCFPLLGQVDHVDRQVNTSHRTPIILSTQISTLHQHYINITATQQQHNKGNLYFDSLPARRRLRDFKSFKRLLNRFYPIAVTTYFFTDLKLHFYGNF